MSAIRDNLAAVAVVLETAEKHGLPLPYSASATDYKANAQMHLDELIVWAEWLGCDTSAEEYAERAEIHHYASADFDGRPVEFIAVERVTQEVAS